jgi:CRISPR-associated protein Cas5t
MLGVYVTVPIACFRKGLAREYLETEPLPPPATCYGFLLSLVGETGRMRHVGVRTCPVLLNQPEISVVLRTVWRRKDKNYWVDPEGQHHVVSTTKRVREAFLKWVRERGWPEPEFEIGLGAGTNARPDYQQLLSPVFLLIWLDSSGELAGQPTLEDRVTTALDIPSQIARFGGLSLGESTHLVDEVSFFDAEDARFAHMPAEGRAFLLADRGRLTLPVWVDHVGSAGTNYVTGDLVPGPLTPPSPERMPQILPRG